MRYLPSYWRLIYFFFLRFNIAKTLLNQLHHRTAVLGHQTPTCQVSILRCLGLPAGCYIRELMNIPQLDFWLGPLGACCGSKISVIHILNVDQGICFDNFRPDSHSMTWSFIRLISCYIMFCKFNHNWNIWSSKD